jgi:hypothetical protein
VSTGKLNLEVSQVRINSTKFRYQQFLSDRVNFQAVFLLFCREASGDRSRLRVDAKGFL